MVNCDNYETLAELWYPKFADEPIVSFGTRIPYEKSSCISAPDERKISMNALLLVVLLLEQRAYARRQKYYSLFDGLGSIVGMTDSSGNEVNRYDYDPYGVMLHQQEQSGFTNLFKFAGGQYRSSTGLYKFGERYYDPSLGRWTQQDSVASGNRYVYAGDDPVNAVDPSGKDARACVAAILAAVVLDSAAIWALYQVVLLGIGLTIDIPIVGPVISASIAVAGFFIGLDVSIFIYNTSIAPYCGLPQQEYLPLSSP